MTGEEYKVNIKIGRSSESRSRRESEWIDQAIAVADSCESRSTCPFRESDRLVLVRVCTSGYVGTSSLSYDYDHYLGQTRLSVSTRSRAGRSPRFSRVILDSWELQMPLSLSFSLFLFLSREPSTRSQLPIDSFKAQRWALHQHSLSRTQIPHRRFMYFLRSPSKYMISRAA